MKESRSIGCLKCGCPQPNCHYDGCEGEEVTEAWSEKFDKKFLFGVNSDGYLLLKGEGLSNLKSFISSQLKQSEFEAYKKGVADEIKCFETSGEHSEQISKLLKQAEAEGYERGRKENIMAVDLKIIRNYNKNLKDESSELVKIIKETAQARAVKDLLERLDIGKYEGEEQPDCGDPACFCGGYKFTEEEQGYNQAKDELLAFKNKELKSLREK